MAVSLAEIARHANVSAVTVSRALRGVGRMSPQTRTTIRQYAAKLGYQPITGVLTRPAVGRGKGEHRLHILLPVFGSSTEPATGVYGQEIIKGLGQRLELIDGQVVIEQARTVDEVAAIYRQRRFNAIVLRQAIPRAWVRDLIGLGPVALAAASDYLPGVDLVHINEHRAAAASLDYLWSKGHREIAWLSLLDRNSQPAIPEKLDPNVAADRQLPSVLSVRHGAWANLAMCQYRPWKMPFVLRERDWNKQSLEATADDCLAELLALRPQPTAVIVSTDVLAMALAQAARRRGLELPRDLSLMGYGFEGSDPWLTIINQPMQVIGRAIPELIERRLAMPDAIPASLTLECPIRDGQSVAPLAQGSA